jgi:hypothetical protein
MVGCWLVDDMGGSKASELVCCWPRRKRIPRRWKSRWPDRPAYRSLLGLRSFSEVGGEDWSREKRGVFTIGGDWGAVEERPAAD